MTTFHITKFEGTQEELVQLMAERMVAKDGMITAIKRVREVKGWHLKDAKDWVESVTGRSVSSP